MKTTKHLTLILVLAISLYGFTQANAASITDEEVVQTQNIEETQNQNETNSQNDKSYTFIGVNLNLFAFYIPFDAGLQFIYCPKGSFGFSINVNHFVMGSFPLLGISIMPIFKHNSFFFGVGLHTYCYYGEETDDDLIYESNGKIEFWDRFVPSVKISLGWMFGSKFKFGLALNYNIGFIKDRDYRLFTFKILLGF